VLAGADGARVLLGGFQGVGYLRPQRGAIRVQRIAGAGLDQRFEHALVDARAAHAPAQIAQIAKRLARGFRGDGLADRAPHALERAQAVADGARVHRHEHPR